MVSHQPDNSVGNFNYNAVFYQGRNWNPHFHKNFELVCVLDGLLTVTVNGRTEILSAGRFALILSNQIHSYECSNSSLYWVAVFSEDFVPEFAAAISQKQGKSISFSCSAETEAFIREHLIQKEAPSLYMKKACLYAVCDTFLSEIVLEDRKEKTDILIGKIIDYLADHYSEDITLSALSQTFGYDYHYFSRLFRQNYQIDFCRILNDYRVEKAGELLRQGSMPITDIAYLCGFQSIRSFNRIYKQQNGRTPKQDYKPDGGSGG